MKKSKSYLLAYQKFSFTANSEFGTGFNNVQKL